MLKTETFPWHRLVEDLARELRGYDESVLNIVRRLKVGINQDEKAACDLLDERLQTKLATSLYTDILSGVVRTTDINGVPFVPYPGSLLPFGNLAPRLSVASGNEWLAKKGYEWTWAPMANVNKRDAVNRERYETAYSLGFRFPEDPAAKLSGTTKIASMMFLPRQTLTDSLLEFRRDHPDEY